MKLKLRMTQASAATIKNSKNHCVKNSRNIIVAVTHRQTFLYCVFMDSLHINDLSLATRMIH